MARETVSAGDQLIVSDPPAIADLAAFTFACWLLNDGSALGATGRLFSKANSAGTEMKCVQVQMAFTMSRLCATVRRSTLNASATTVNGLIVNGVWMHLALTYDEAGGIHLYKDGTECEYASPATVGSGATLADAGGDLSFFNVRAGGSALDGRLAEIGMWNRVLTADELAVLASKRYWPGLIRAGLVGAWRLLGQADPEPDAVNGQSAVVVGAVPAAHPAGIISALPERVTCLGTQRGALRAMG